MDNVKLEGLLDKKVLEALQDIEIPVYISEIGFREMNGELCLYCVGFNYEFGKLEESYELVGRENFKLHAGQGVIEKPPVFINVRHAVTRYAGKEKLGNHPTEGLYIILWRRNRRRILNVINDSKVEKYKEVEKTIMKLVNKHDVCMKPNEDYVNMLFSGTIENKKER